MGKHTIVITFAVVIAYVQLSSGFWLWGDGNKNKVNGQWGEWSNYSSCQVSSDVKIPYRFRTRKCDNPSPKAGGKQCKGQSLRQGPCSDCDQPLGIENKVVTNSELSASTSHEEFPPQNARLNGPSAWCAKELSGEVYLQVDFESLTLVTAIATQGYYPDPKELSLRLGSVSKYQITFSDNGVLYEVYENSQNEKVFTGNGRNLKTVLNTFEPQIAAKHIRVHPMAFIIFVCMKIELYGCRFKCGGYLPPTPGDLLAVSSETEDVDCFWQARLTNSSKINFDFINFNLPCKHGQVQLKGGFQNYGGSKDLGTFCQVKTPIAPSVQTNGNKLWIRFTSNSSDANVGFYGMYFPSCDVVINNTETGTITTPGYPKMYNHNSKCSWSIAVPEGFIIQLKFLDFDIERHSECSNDYLSVIDKNSTAIAKYCNSNKPPELICSSSNTIKVVFKSDDVLALRGFKATFKTLKAGSPCIEEVSSSITPTPSLSYASSLTPFSSSEVLIVPTSTINVQPSIKHNDSISFLVTGSGVPGLGAGNHPGEDDDDDDDEDNGLTTIIIISVFSFIVLCMLIASIIPSLMHGIEKRKRERQWLAAADVAVKKKVVQNQYEMQPIPVDKNKKDDIEPNEETAFLEPDDQSSVQEECHLMPVDCSLKKHEISIRADSYVEDTDCDGLEYDTTDLNLSTSYEDIGTSFAHEMAALMFKYDSTPITESNLETDNLATDKKQERAEEQNATVQDEPNRSKNAPTSLVTGERSSDLELISSPETEQAENLTNSTVSIRDVMDISAVPSVQTLPELARKSSNLEGNSEDETSEEIQLPREQANVSMLDGDTTSNIDNSQKEVVPETFV